MKNINKERRILIISLILVALIMIFAYITTVTNLSIISVDGVASSDVNVTFSSVSSKGTAINNDNVTVIKQQGNNLILTFSARFQKPGDYAEYSAVITNTADVPVKLYNYIADNANVLEENGIQFFITGLNEGDIIAGGGKKDIIVRAEWDAKATEYPTIMIKNYSIKLTFIQS